MKNIFECSILFLVCTSQSIVLYCCNHCIKSLISFGAFPCLGQIFDGIPDISLTSPGAQNFPHKSKSLDTCVITSASLVKILQFSSSFCSTRRCNQTQTLRFRGHSLHELSSSHASSHSALTCIKALTHDYDRMHDPQKR